MTARQPLRPLAVTMGEPSGIGGELVLRARMQTSPGPFFFVCDDPLRLQALAGALALDVAIETIDAPSQARLVWDRGALPVVPVSLPQPAVCGRPVQETAPAVIGSIEQAVGYALAGDVGGVVTNPVHKATLYAAGFGHQGHTDFLAHLCGGTSRVVMMLTSSTVHPPLRVVPVTVHVSLRQAIDDVTSDLVVETVQVTHHSLVTLFGLARPRLALAALNPHAGEAGTMGTEEETIIQPALERLRREGIDISPPLSADTLFHAQSRGRYDAIICMYHDQALIPLKTIDFAGGVNVTLGLPIIRTSPDHGPALDIAGSGRANAQSFMAALALADELARHRGA